MDTPTRNIATVCSAPRGARGFSLMEVLMAAFVMGLGVLGLTALFAGAARQQQLASMQTRAGLMRSSAEAMLADQLGQIERFDGDANLRHPCTGVFANDIVDDVWYPVPMEDVNSGAALVSGAFLSLNPTNNPTNWSNDDLLIRLRPSKTLPILLYRAQPVSNVIPVGFSGMDYTGVPPNAHLLWPFNSGAPLLAGGLPDFGILADSLKVRVITRAHPASGATNKRNLSLYEQSEISYQPASGVNPNDANAELSGADGGFIWVDTQPDIISPADASEFAKIDTLFVSQVWDDTLSTLPGGANAHVQVNPGDLDYDGARQVYIAGVIGVGSSFVEQVSVGSAGYRIMDPATGELVFSPVDKRYPTNALFAEGSGSYTFNDTGNLAGFRLLPLEASKRYVHEIWLDEYEIRARRLVSGGDRITRDASGKPIMGFTVLFRRRAGGETEFAVISYAIAAGQGGAADFVPPERCQDYGRDDAPLRLAEGVRLRYDTELDKYFVQVDDRDDRQAWIARAGQVLLFAGKFNPSNANDQIPGADSAVSVQTVRVVETGGQRLLRAYLDGAPRAGMSNLLALENTANNPVSTAGVDFDIWGIQPTASSVHDDSQWKLEPIGATVFTGIE